MLVSDTRTAEWGDAVEAIERCYELGWTDGSKTSNVRC